MTFKPLGLALISVMAASCASLTNNAMTPVKLSLSDESQAQCVLTNKRGSWKVELPNSVWVRRSDDALRYACDTPDGRFVEGSIPSSMGGKIVASALFLDMGITDAITDKHREYPESYVIPIKPSR
jgi:hypothetical protein